MELATLAEVRYTPKFRGNRERPPGQRGDVLLIPLSGMDSLLDYTEEDLRAWATERLKPLGHIDAYIGARIDSLHVDALRMLRVIDDHTRDWRGWTLYGEPVTDGMRLCLRPMPPPAATNGQVREQSLFLEIQDALSEASVLTEDELGNWTALFDGTASAMTSVARPVSEGASPGSASTPEEQTAASS